MKAEDVQPCRSVGFEGWSLLTPREGFFWRGGRDGSGTVHLAEGAPEIIPTSSLTVDSSVTCHPPYLKGSQGTQTEVILRWTWYPSGPVWFRKGRSILCSNRKQLFHFSPPEGDLGAACPQTGHLTLYSHEFIKSHCLSCAIILLFLEVNQIPSMVNKHWAGPPTFLFIFKMPGVPWMTSSIWPRKIRDEKCCPTAGKNISIWLHYYMFPWVCVHWITVLSGT